MNVTLGPSIPSSHGLAIHFNKVIASSLGLVFLLCAGFAPGVAPLAQAQDIRLENNSAVITGPLQVRLAFTDQNGVLQDIPLQQLSSAQFSSLPGPLQQAKNLVLLQGNAVSYFDQLWNQTRGNVCGDIYAEIKADINTSDNSAYNVNCNTNPRGALLAVIQNGWEDDYGFWVQGRRLILDYWVPDNWAVFTVTTPCTCQQSSLTCPADPQFTLVFDVHLVVKFVSNDPASLALPFTDAHSGSVEMDLVAPTDLSQVMSNAAHQWATEMDESILTGGVTSPTDLFTGVAKLAVQLGAIGFSAACEAISHLPDTVSADLGTLGSGNAGSAAVSVSQQLGALFQDLLPAPNGFTQFDIVGGSDGSLIFRWTAPPATKPALFNMDAESNSQPTLFRPMIAADQTQVPAGSTLTVHGYWFGLSYATDLKVGWSATLPGSPATAYVDWQQQGGPIQHATTTQGFFEADGLRPGTTYEFRVRLCTPITCTPLSDWFAATTQGQGSDRVVLSLDDAAHTVGSATLAGGSFTTSAAIPQSTTPGQHTLYATVGAQGTSLSFRGALVRHVMIPHGTISAPHLLSPITRLRALPPSGGGPNRSAANPPPRVAVAPNMRSSTIAVPPQPISPGGSNPSVHVAGLQAASLAPIISAPVYVPSGGGEQAKLPIVVCVAGGCNPSIAIVNPNTNEPYPTGGGPVVAGWSFTLEGAAFAPSQGVTIYLDGPSGQSIGTATTDTKGGFWGKFTVPAFAGGSLVSGQHNLIAVQVAGGRTLQASLSIFVDQPPK